MYFRQCQQFDIRVSGLEISRTHKNLTFFYNGAILEVQILNLNPISQNDQCVMKWFLWLISHSHLTDQLFLNELSS